MRIVIEGTAAQGSPTLHILRTPMPFGSPVPYPHSIDGIASPDMLACPATLGAPQGMQPQNRGIPCLPYTLPFELRCIFCGEQGVHTSFLVLCMPCRPSWPMCVMSGVAHRNTQQVQGPASSSWSCTQSSAGKLSVDLNTCAVRAYAFEFAERKGSVAI